MQLAETLFNDYNHYRNFTSSIRSKREGGAYIVDLNLTPVRRTAFEKLAAWCSEREIDARHWLYSLFVTRHWIFAPPLKQLTSKKHLQRYPTMGPLPGYKEHLAAEQRVKDEAAGRLFDCNRDVSHTAETLKIHYLQSGNPGRCMELMSTETWGYHPRSNICARCLIATACDAMLRSRVSFDIQALRRGEITAEQARTLAVYSGAR